MAFDVNLILKRIGQYCLDNPDPINGKRMSLEDFAGLAGISQGTISHWKAGRNNPDSVSVGKICSILGNDLADFLVDAKRMEGKRHYIPIISWTDAGKGIEVIDNYPPGIGEPIYYEIGDPHAFGLRVKGDSMEPYYLENDVIIISPATSCENNDCCVVKFTEEGIDKTVFKKMIIEKDNIRLRSLNVKYDDIVLQKDFKVIGKAVCTIRKT